MSFPVAVQSAIFYFLACTPCAKVRHRHKARQQARKERAERALIEAEQPGLYRHPSPFSTNPYWGEEITMGPSLPKKGGSKNPSQKALTGTGQGTSINSTSASHSENPPTSPTILPEDARDPSFSVTDSSDWNHKRYEREDEELWGHDISRAGHKLMDAIAKAGSSAGRLIEAKLGKEKPITDEDRQNFYFAPKNPPVNDYHPPVVSSRPEHKDGYKWMLQPPPSAKIMEGKVPVSRTGSQTSMGSKRTAISNTDLLEPGLGRIVSKRLVQDKIRKGEVPPDAEMAVLSRPTSGRTATGSTIRAHSYRSTRSARSHSLSLDSEGSSEDSVLDRRRRRRASKRQPVTPEVESEDEHEEDDDRRGGEGLNAVRAAQRPKLETIASSSGSMAVKQKRSVSRSANQHSLAKTVDKPAQPPDTEVEEAVKERAAGSSLDSGLALSETTA